MTGGLVVDLKKRVPGFHLEAAFEAGEGTTVVFGPSGAGKTLLLSIIAGATRADSGLVRAGDAILYDSERRLEVPMRSRRVGWVSQDARLFPHLNVRDNLLYGLRRSPISDRRLSLGPVVSALRLESLLERSVERLSGGEAQRVALGRALLAQPRLLVLDEPLAALDRASRRELLAVLERARDLFQAPMLYVTHDPEEALRLARSVLVLEAGRVVAEGEPLETLGAVGALDPLAATDPLLPCVVVRDADGGALRAEALGETWAARADPSASAPLALRAPVARAVVFSEPPPACSLPNLFPARIQMGAMGQPADLRFKGGVLRGALPSAALKRLGLANGDVVIVGFPEARLVSMPAEASIESQGTHIAI